MAIYELPEVWRDLFVMVGGAAASLVGLLFVVMSLYFNAIQGRQSYSMAATVHAARNNTYHLLTVLITAALVLTPQPSPVLGAELMVIHLFGLRLPIIFTYQHFIKRQGGFPLAMTITIGIGYLLGAAGGAALVGQVPWAFYLVTVSCMTLIVRTVLTSWMLMFGRHEVDAADERPLASILDRSLGDR